MSRWLLSIGLVLGLAACDEQTAPPVTDGAAPTADKGPRDAAAVDAATPDVAAPDTGGQDIQDMQSLDLPAACSPQGTIECVDPTHQRVCQATGWVVEPCPQGTLCLDEQCSADCRDQCLLGEMRTIGGTTETCKPFSVAQNGPVPLSTGTHDRARSYNAFLRKFNLAEDAVRWTVFTDTSYQQIASYGGMRDSAIFTGAYLAAEALRYQATKSPEAQQNLQQVVETVHRLFQVTGHKGYLARFAAPLTGGDPKVAAEYDPNEPEFHKVTYNGQDYYWRGNTSRDAYQGPLLGYGLAYEALTSEPHKQMIRQDIVDLCTELIKDRKQLTVNVRFNLGGQWIELPVGMDLQYVVLNPTEFVNGHPAIQFGSDDNPSDYMESSVMGMREFFPDYAVAAKQVPLLGSLIVFPIIRSGSTIMVASILRLGMLVTANVPQYSAEHAAISAHYAQQSTDWIGKMKIYTFLNSQCWEKYYGLNITMMPTYNLLQLETDPALRAAYLTDVFEAKMWPYVKDHKNVFFSYIYASQAAQSAATQAVATAAGAQLQGFPPPPNAEKPIDNTGKYPVSLDCDNQITVAADVADRQAAYFLWERHPFYLKLAGNPLVVRPGVDYLLAYWMGRAYGLLADDAAGTCLRWQP
jgi:hypothetical protein